MKLGAQVYSVRNQIQTPEGYLKTMQGLKAVGYDTVQHAGAALTDPYLLRDLTQQAGLQQICPNIDAAPLMEDPDKVIEAVRILGCDSIMLPYITPDDFVTLESFLVAWAPLEAPVQKLLDAGITPAYHNHDFDVAPMTGWDGSFVEWLLENRPGWHFILDVCWAEFARVDVLNLLEQIGRRMACVHFKDYRGVTCRHMPVFRACGEGAVALKTYGEKVRAMGIEDVIVEQDNALNYPDPMGQMAASAAYLRKLF